MKYLDIKKHVEMHPKTSAHLESWKVTLIEESPKALSYNIVRFADLFWGVHHAEGGFEIARWFEQGASQPLVVGESADEVRVALDRLPQKSSLSIRRSNLKDFQQLDFKNFYILKDDVREAVARKSPDLPALRNSLVPTVDLFSPGDGQPLTIISPAPSRACNYRCKYCYNHDYDFMSHKDEFDMWADVIRTGVSKIPRPLKLSIGTMGEPMLTPAWLEVVYDLAMRDNVELIGFVSNLSADFGDFFKRMGSTRVGILASLHVSQFRDKQRDFQKFIDTAKYAQDQGASLVVSQVLTPEQITVFNEYAARLEVEGLPFLGNVLRGPYLGKMYPEAYTEEEWAFVKKYTANYSFVYDYQSHEQRPYGLECSSGRHGLFIEFDGSIYNCHFARQKFGNIYDEAVLIRDANGYCTSNFCECQTTVGWQKKVADKFEMLDSFHHFALR